MSQKKFNSFINFHGRIFFFLNYVFCPSHVNLSVYYLFLWLLSTFLFFFLQFNGVKDEESCKFTQARCCSNSLPSPFHLSHLPFIRQLRSFRRKFTKGFPIDSLSRGGGEVVVFASPWLQETCKNARHLHWTDLLTAAILPPPSRARVQKKLSVRQCEQPINQKHNVFFFLE